MNRREFVGASLVISSPVIAGCLQAQRPQFGETVTSGKLAATAHEFKHIEQLRIENAESTYQPPPDHGLILIELTVENAATDRRRFPDPRKGDCYLINQGRTAKLIESPTAFLVNGTRYPAYSVDPGLASEGRFLPPDTTVRGWIAYRYVKPFRAAEAIFGVVLHSNAGIENREWRFT